MSEPRQEQRKQRWLGPALGLLWLHALCAVRYPWENVPHAASWLRVSLDLVVLSTLAAALAAWLRSARRRAVLVHGASLLLLGVLLFRFAFTVMPVFYGKELDLYNDIDMAPGLVHLLLHRHGLPLQIVLVLAALLSTALAYYLTQRSWWVVLTTLDGMGRRRWLAVAGASLLALVGNLDLQGDDASHFVAPHLADDAARSALEVFSRWRELSEYDEQLESARRRLDGIPTNLARLRGTDFFVLFIESYGRCLFRDDPLRARLAAWSAPWLERLDASGYSMRTAFAFPSVRGGNSSMAHAEFMSGVPTWTRRTFDRLLASDLRSLPTFFRAAGYRTYNVQPAMPRAWEEGKFFGFTDDLFRPAFPYEGTPYHWGSMPDQYALAVLLKEHLRASAQPVFVQIVSVTSHAPFSMIPPYVEDWEAAALSTAFAGPPAHDFGISWLEFVGHPKLAEAYLESIHYSLDTVFHFITQLERDAIVMVLGDHQPPRIGAFQEADETFDVPVHVIARNDDLLAAFEPFGFQPGFLPSKSTGNFSTSRFLAALLETLSEPESR